MNAYARIKTIWIAAYAHIICHCPIFSHRHRTIIIINVFVWLFCWLVALFFLRYVTFSAHLRLLHINLTTFAFICSILGLPSLLLPKHAFYVWQFGVRFIWLFLLTLLTISLTHVIFLIFSFTRPEFSVEIYLWHKIFGCQSNVKQLPLTGKNVTLFTLPSKIGMIWKTVRFRKKLN